MAQANLKIVSAAAPSDRPTPPEANAESNIRTLREVALALSAAASALETSVEDDRQRVNVENGIDLDDEVSRFESELIRRALVRTHGNQKRASVLLNLKPTTLNTKIKKYNIRVEV
jgi:DNA-binding NtrC family response regulator